MLLSIIVPTYQEGDNLEPLCRQFAAEFEPAEYEVLIMDDDSQDNSAEVVAKLKAQQLPVQLINRKDQVPSLSAAVIDGFQLCRGDYCCVLDADLSHPVSAIRPMLAKLRTGEATFCLGSRYVPGASLDEAWTWKRRLISQVATLLAMPLCRLKDPLSGFFLLARATLPPREKLSPLGYKIALELIVKGNFRKIYEHPIHFSQRLHGSSKMNVRQQFFYLRHLRRLYQYRYPTVSEFMQFGLVGSSGFLVDVAIYYALQLFLGLNHALARAISFWFGASWNWFWNRTLTFSEYFKSNPLKQWLSFVLVSSCGFALNWGSYYLLTQNLDFFTSYKILALMAGVLVGLGFNFMFSRLLIFRHLAAE